MYNISSLNKRRPKSSNYRQALTEYNVYNKRPTKQLNIDIPFLKEKITKKFCFRKFCYKNPEYSYKNFYTSSTPFNYYRNKNNKNECFASFNGGPKIKINRPKKLEFNLDDMPKIRYNSQFHSNFFKKPCGCLVNNRYFSNNKYKLKKKEDNIDNNKKLRLVTDFNNNDFDYDYKYYNEDINSGNNYINKIENCKNEEICEKKDDKDEFNFFKMKPKRRFHKIQIHNRCKPFLVEHYRYYAEKYL